MQMGFLKWLVKCVRKNITNKNLYVYLSSAIPMWIVAWLSPFLVGLAAFLLWTVFWVFYNLYDYYREVVAKRRVQNGSA